MEYGDVVCEQCGKRFDYDTFYAGLVVSPVLCGPCLYGADDE